MPKGQIQKEARDKMSRDRSREEEVREIVAEEALEEGFEANTRTRVIAFLQSNGSFLGTVEDLALRVGRGVDVVRPIIEGFAEEDNSGVVFADSNYLYYSR